MGYSGSSSHMSEWDVIIMLKICEFTPTLPHVHMTTFSETILYCSRYCTCILQCHQFYNCIIMIMALCRALTDVNAKQVRVRQAAQELTEQ